MQTTRVGIPLQTTSDTTANLRTKILEFRGFDSNINLPLRGGNDYGHREFPRKFESPNLSRDHLSRVIGRIHQQAHIKHATCKYAPCTVCSCEGVPAIGSTPTYSTVQYKHKQAISSTRKYSTAQTHLYPYAAQYISRRALETRARRPMALGWHGRGRRGESRGYELLWRQDASLIGCLVLMVYRC